MGNGKKKSNGYASFRKNTQRERLYVVRTRQRKKDNIKKGITAGGIAVGVTAVILAIVIMVNSTGIAMRNRVALSCNEQEIDNAMLAYFFYSAFDDYSAQYGTETVDLNKSLKKQYFSDDSSWYDYIMSITLDSTKRLFSFAVAAQAEGMALNEKEQAAIDGYIKMLENNAQADGISLNKYISQRVCKGVNSQDVRKCLELSVLACKYYEKTNSELNYTSDRLEQYKSENPNGFLYVDYKSYSFNYNIPADATEQEAAEIKNASKADAEGLAACHTVKKFDAYVEAFIKEAMENSTSATTDHSYIESAIKNTLKEGYAYDVSKDLGYWAFSQAKKVGETIILEGTNQYTVYMLVKTPYIKTDATKTVRHILFTADSYGSDALAKEQAERVLALWREEGEAEEFFATLAAIYSNDPGSGTQGGLYKNISSGRMVSEFDSWCFDSARKTGDYEIIKTDFGYHIMYFCSEGLIEWQKAAYEQLFDTDYANICNALEQKYPIFTAEKFNVPGKRN